jgi:hypothetical protein
MLLLACPPSTPGRTRRSHPKEVTAMSKTKTEVPASKISDRIKKYEAYDKLQG